MGTITAQIQLTEAELKLLQTLVYQECGMFFDERRSHFLKDRLQRRLKAVQVDSFYSYYRLLTSREGRAELALLLENLTVNETSFFRNRPQLDLLQKSVLEDLLHRKQERRDWTLRVWSAGCSSGQEAYTVGMLICDALAYYYLRMTKVVVSQGVANQHANGVGFLAGGAPGTPNADGPIAAFLLSVQQIFQYRFLQQIQLRAVTKEAGFVDREIFQEQCQLGAAFAAGEQPVIAVEGIELNNFQTALQAVFEKMGAAFIEEHSAFLIHQGLQQLEFSVGELNLCGNRSH